MLARVIFSFPIPLHEHRRSRKISPKKTAYADSEVDRYIGTYITSSNRVRYAIIAITVASILLLVGHLNSFEESWFNSRLKLAYVAVHEEVWLYQDGNLQGNEELARRWAEARGYETEEEIRYHIKSLEDARTNRLLLLEVPFFGVSHDVNDLGLLGGVALTVLMTMLTMAMSRQHENLYLVLWRVRRAFDSQDQAIGGESRANRLYHTLAMSQQFRQSPTLARWKGRRLKGIARSLLILPLVAQMLCFGHDLSTLKIGMLINRRATILSIAVQGLSLLLVVMLVWVCYVYTKSNNKRWIKTFEAINRSYIDKDQPTWLEWVQIRPRKEDYCKDYHGGGKFASGTE